MNWFADKSRIYCEKPIGLAHHLDHAPALLGPDGLTVEWNRFRTERAAKCFRNSSGSLLETAV